MRSGLVRDLGELERYRWCGHDVLVGREYVRWQKSDEILSYFGEESKKARLEYWGFVLEGIDQGRRPDLTSGGFSRKMTGKEKVAYEERHLEGELSNARILGSGDFVEVVLGRKEGESKALRFK